MSEHYYREVTLFPSEEGDGMTLGVLASAVMQRVHHVIAGGAQVFVSFPQLDTVRPTGVGRIIRLHGRPEDLNQFSMPNGIEDYTTLSDVRLVPRLHSLRVFERVQVKGSSRYRRMARYAEKHGKPVEHLLNGIAQHIDNAYVTIRSSSTAQSFKLFIKSRSYSASGSTPSGSAAGYGLGRAVPVF